MTTPPQSDLYRIRVRGALSDRLLLAFPEFQAHAERGDTILCGPLPDQVALFDVFETIQGLGLKLLELRCDPAGSPGRDG